MQASDVKEVAECDEQRLGELLLCPVPAINRPQLLDAQITKIGLYLKGAIIDPAGIAMLNELVPRNGKNAEVVASENAGNLATRHARSPVKAR